MTCCCSNFGGAAERQFTQKKAAQELTRYRQKGPGPTTRLLQDGLLSAKTVDGVLLDIGCGIGSLTFGLLQAGVTRAVAVDASSAYLAAATQEAGRRGVADVIRFVHGDFVTVAAEVPFASVVTLDRVVCCYPSYELLNEALRHSERCIALSYPRDVWFVRAGVALENGGRRLKRNPFRTFVHSAGGMGEVIAQAGFELVSRRHTFAWAADVYMRRT
jgi:SAM-dependent methyltransferase